MKVRIDLWPFMRRLAKTVANESHPLYSTFMCSISKAIFKWDPKDENLLNVNLPAKKEELEMAGIPPHDAVKRAITKKELAKHCERRTRGSNQTILLLDQLFESMKGKTDTLGVPLRLKDFQHVCSADKREDVCRCARGTTSLESFHLHLKKPQSWYVYPQIRNCVDFRLQIILNIGTSANDVHFQAYLLDGLAMWNDARTSAASDAPVSSTRSFNVHLQDKLGGLSRTILGESLDKTFSPSTYTGELLGIGYLYYETNKSIPALEDVDNEIEKGVMEDDYALDATSIPDKSGTSDSELDFAFDAFNCSVPSQSEIEEDVATSATDWNGVPGWDKVVLLAVALVDQKTGPVNKLQADSILSLYN